MQRLKMSVDITLKKHKSNNKLVKGEVIVLDSHDGAEHCTSSGIRASIASHNSQIFPSPCNMMKGKHHPAKSFNILIWQQILADEKLENIIPAVDSMCEEKKKLMGNANSIVDEYNFNFMMCTMQRCSVS